MRSFMLNAKMGKVSRFQFMERRCKSCSALGINVLVLLVTFTVYDGQKKLAFY